MNNGSSTEQQVTQALHLCGRAHVGGRARVVGRAHVGTKGMLHHGVQVTCIALTRSAGGLTGCDIVRELNDASL